MSEFVKLTGAYGSGAFYINVQRVESFYGRKDGATYVCTTPDGDQAYEVTETPEQIMALIDGPADRDALVDDLVGALSFLMATATLQNTPGTQERLASIYNLIDRVKVRK